MLQRFGGRDGKFLRPMQVARALRVLADFQAFEDLALHGGAQSPDALQSVLARSGFERGQVADAEFLTENVDFLRFETGDRQHVEDTLRDILAQLFQQRMRAGAVQLGDDVGDRHADSGQPAQAVFGDDAVERLDQRREPVRGALIGFGAEVIVAGERCAPAELDQQRGHGRCVEHRHFSVAAAARPAGFSSAPPSGR